MYESKKISLSKLIHIDKVLIFVFNCFSNPTKIYKCTHRLAFAEFHPTNINRITLNVPGNIFFCFFLVLLQHKKIYNIDKSKYKINKFFAGY